MDNSALVAETGEDDDHVVENLAWDGDEDAALIMDFEAAAAELVQTEEMAAAYTVYTEARER